MTHGQAVRWGIAWLCGTAGWVQAQEIASEREQLQRQRQAIESRYAQDTQNCYQRFAVNDCKQEALKAQREGLKSVRAREQALDGAERAEKAQAQKARVAERLSPQAQEEEAQRRAQAVERQQSSEQKNLEKQQAHAERAEKGVTETPARDVARPTAAELRASEQDHARKLQDAQAHRTANEQRRQDRQKPLAAPLPVPSMGPTGNGP
jgi:colicin import membrane protein